MAIRNESFENAEDHLCVLQSALVGDRILFKGKDMITGFKHSREVVLPD